MPGWQAKGYVREEQTALSTMPPLPQQLCRGLQAPLPVPVCKMLLPCQSSGRRGRERGRGLIEQDSNDPNQPGKVVSDSPPQTPSCTARGSCRPKAERGATVKEDAETGSHRRLGLLGTPRSLHSGNEPQAITAGLQACRPAGQCPCRLFASGVPPATAYLPVGS